MTDVVNSALPPEAASTAIVSYNLHGLQQGVPLLQLICDELAPSAIFIQEHWQTPINLHKISNFSKSYTGYGISAMEVAVTNSILKGSPWGGVNIMINNKYSKRVKTHLCIER